MTEGEAANNTKSSVVLKTPPPSPTNPPIPPPDKKVKFPIPGNDTGGCLFLFGDEKSSNIVFCCAGFPDDQGALSPLASRLAKESNCFVGVTCLPGYGDAGDNNNTEPRENRWKPCGYTVDEIVISLREAAKTLREQSTYEGEKNLNFTCIFHDWGCIFGLIYVNRILDEEKESKAAATSRAPNQVVLFDIGAPPSKPDREGLSKHPENLYYALIQTAYTLLHAVCFVVYWKLSRMLALIFYKVGWFTLEMLCLSPVRQVDHDTMTKAGKPVGSKDFLYMMYPYYYFWKIALSGHTEKELSDFRMPVLQQTPVLLVTGMDKVLQFHDGYTEEALRRENCKGSKSNAIAVQNAGHWLYLQQEELCLKEVQKFINA